MLISLLNNLKQKQFTGIVDIRSPKSKQPVHWKIYFCLGKLIWADGGIHPVRTLQRHIKKFCPQLDLNKIDFTIHNKCKCKEYSFFSNLLQQETIQQEQFNQVVITRIEEILFDIFQQEAKESIDINTQEIPASSLLEYGFKISNAVFDANLIIDKAQKSWLTWVDKELQSISPNYSPIIADREKLQQVVSPTIYKNFASWLNGKHSLRDLAIKINKDLLQLTLSLMPYIKTRLVKFTVIKDAQLVNKLDNSSVPKRASGDNQPIITCIDDSPQIIYIMEQIITKAGYHFVGIKEPIKAVPSLISNVPDLIFLDIGMPVLNGYEVCLQIQRVSKLQGVPIVMLTGNDGIVDRVRAKLVGASDFVSKPIEADVITKTIKKFAFAESENVIAAKV